ncbi:MAG: PEGA domain-containing protein [Acetatifactor sp.]|nr:PEGA domain-containing protein [Acetatifactor sp.]
MARDIQRVKLAAVLLMTAILCAACSGTSEPVKSPDSDMEQEAVKETYTDTGFVLTGPDSYDSEDTAILLKKNGKENSLTFLNLDLGKKYTLSMDGTTKIYDKYGESLSLEQLEIGDIVDVTFLKGKKHLNSIRLSEAAWINRDVERYEINWVRKEVTLGQDVYKLGSNTQYLSNARAIEAMDINPADVLTFKGIGNEILSISVDKGHGYLRLANDENFIGGWIEIGNSIIQPITEDMLLTVPEGSYQVNISFKGSGGDKKVIINRNEETTLDIGDLQVAEAQYGTVLFSITPDNADVYIDAASVDVSNPVKLEYGIHQLIVKATGYQSITRYLRVGQESAGIDITLDAVSDDDDEEEEDSGEEEKPEETEDNKDTVTDYYKVYVDAPEGVEVYLDGNYVGISPCSFRKEAGAHVITLRKTGCETRSYTVQVDKENRDFSYSFVDLIPTGTGE